ncbi:MAG: hypothetical protein HOV79_21695, partial [Hamadaea sp.]|nr:hypothetical protein [Hamadaea sp.]
AASRPGAGAYAGGVARPPSPPTMVGRGDEFAAPEPPARSRRTIAAMMVTGGVLAVLLGIMLAYSLSSPFDGGDAAPPNGGAGTSAAEASPTEAESPSPSPSPSPDVSSIVGQLDAVIDNAQVNGKRERDLRNRLNELREAINRGDAGRIRDRINSLKEKAEDFADDGDLDQQSADQIVSLLDQLEDQLGV